MSLFAWFESSPYGSPRSLRRRQSLAAERCRQSRRLFLEGLEDRSLMAFNFLADFATGANPQDLAVASLNADSLPDLAVANYGSGNVGTRLGTGVGAFGPL